MLKPVALPRSRPSDGLAPLAYGGIITIDSLTTGSNIRFEFVAVSLSKLLFKKSLCPSTSTLENIIIDITNIREVTVSTRFLMLSS